MLFGCGIAARDYDIEQTFTTGGLPGFDHSFNATQLSGPLSADVSKLSTVTLKAARIEATDGAGDIHFVSAASISVSSNLLPDALLATLAVPPGLGQNSADLFVTGKELKPYLQAGGTVSANISYSPVPAAARELKLVLTLHGSLL